MRKAPILLGLVLLCSACTAPSLRYKKEISQQMSAGQYKEASEQMTSSRKKYYAQQDADLFYLDRAVLLHEAQDYSASDDDLENAQYLIEQLYTKSVSASAGRLLINDLTSPYYVSPYERALTYYYRAMNFLSQNNLSGALVEARKAVFYLDHLRAEKKSGYNDDPFVQYFASLVFESGGQVDDARIARQNAYNAYTRLGKTLELKKPVFKVPDNADSLGEIIIVSSSGLMPLKKTETMQVTWDRALLLVNTGVTEGNASVSPEVQNALTAGLAGNAVTLSYPVWEDQPYEAVSAEARVGGVNQKAVLAANLEAAAKEALKEQLPGMIARLAARAVSKQVLSVQARQAAAQLAKDNNIGELAGMLFSALGAAVERADTRQWFTPPARIYLNRIFVSPGTKNVTLLFRDRYGNIVEEKTFENVTVRRGGRVYLHYRARR